MSSSGADPLRPGLSRKQIAAVVAGNGLEFYDFLTYSFFAAQIGEALFPGGGDTKLLLSLATFGVGFATRPLGGFVIGRMADRKGRRPAMLLTFALMGLALVGIALTGFGMEEDIRKTREAGFKYHLVKPIDLTKLDQLIQQSVATDSPV